jgi:uncharacterized repeat protein (TIGR01451 family)
VNDPKAPECNRTKADIPALASMAVGASVTYRCTKRVDESFSSPNVAIATGKPPTGPSVTDRDSARVHVLAPFNPAITIAKCPDSVDNCRKSVNGVPVDTQTVAEVGGTANFRITVRNTGDVTLTDVTVTDPRAPDCDRELGTMAPGASRTYTCPRADVTEPLTNVARVVGTSPRGSKLRDRDPSRVLVPLAPLNPGIAIAKCPATVAAPACNVDDNQDQQNEDGWTASFRILVVNTGDVVLRNVTVTDQLSPSCNRTFATIAPGDSRTYTCTNTRAPVPVAPGEPECGYLNEARVVAATPQGTRVRDFNRSSVQHRAEECKTG